jgi:hypothetical protein
VCSQNRMTEIEAVAMSQLLGGRGAKANNRSCCRHLCDRDQS